MATSHEEPQRAAATSEPGSPAYARSSSDAVPVRDSGAGPDAEAPARSRDGAPGAEPTPPPAPAGGPAEPTPPPAPAGEPGSAASGPGGKAGEQSGAKEAGAAGQSPGERPPATDGAGQVTIVPGVARYHRSGCILIRFLGADDLETLTRSEARAAGCIPCRACQPDEEPGDG